MLYLRIAIRRIEVSFSWNLKPKTCNLPLLIFPRTEANRIDQHSLMVQLSKGFKFQASGCGVTGTALGRCRRTAPMSFARPPKTHWDKGPLFRNRGQGSSATGNFGESIF